MDEIVSKGVWLLVALLALAPARAAADAADDQYAVAAGHYALKRWTLAATEFETLLADHPESPRGAPARFFLAEALVQMGRFAEARDQFAKFLAAAPEHDYVRQARFRMGECGYFGGDAERALLDLDAFLTKHPDDALAAYALAYLGSLQIEAKQPALARDTFTAALDRFPDGAMSDHCRFGLAQSLAAVGDTAAAAEAFRGIAEDATNAFADDARFELAAALYEAGDYKAAVESFQQLQSRFPDSELTGKADLGRAWCFYHIERYDEAQPIFETLADDPRLGPQARYWIGLTAWARENWRAAADALMHAIQHDPDPALLPAMRYYAGDAFARLEAWDQALEQFGHIQVDAPESAHALDAFFGKMRVRFGQGDHAAVDALAGELLARDLDDGLRRQVERLRAESLLAAKQYARAREILESLAEDETAPPATQYLLARALEGERRYDAALGALDGVGEEDAKLADDVLLARGVMLVGAGRLDEALAPLEQYLSNHENAPSAAQCRGQLAICHARRGDFEKARQAFSSLEEHHAGHEVVLPTVRALAEAAYAGGDRAWSTELFARLASQTNSAEHSAEGFSGLAWSQYQEGDLMEAVETFQRLITTYPENELAAEAALARGRILEELDQPDAALAMYHRAADDYADRPVAPKAMLAAARLHAKQSQVRDAVALYERLDREHAGFADHDAVLYEWAWLLQQENAEAESDALFERIRQQFSESRYWGDVVYRLAERAWKAKDHERAVTLAEEVATRSDNAEIRAHALFLQSQIAVSAGRWNEAAAPLERLLESSPESSLRLLAQYWLAEAAYRREEYESAGERFAALAELLNGRDDAWAPMVPLRQAQVFAHGKQWRETLAIAETIEERFPEFPRQYEVDYLLGRCRAALGEFDAAREHYQQAVASPRGARTETQAMAQWMIGESYFHQKNYREAIRAYLRVDVLYAYPTWQAAALLQAGKCHEALEEYAQATEVYARLVNQYPDTTFVEEASDRMRAVGARVARNE